MFKDKTILITGGAGSLGHALAKKLLSLNCSKIRILDINETALFFMHEEFRHEHRLRFFIGDIRDLNRLTIATRGVDIVFHLDALKHVMSSEYNPFETIQTNIIGTNNVIEAALVNDVDKVIFASTDKAANPDNLMGTTKLAAEKLLTAAFYQRGLKKTKFCSVRFGNVMGTRGSVLDLWMRQYYSDEIITITDPEITRFMMTKSQAIDLIIEAAKLTIGGEVFIYRMPVVCIKDLFKAFQICNNNLRMNFKIIGKKPGETNHEELLSRAETEYVVETDKLFIILSPMIEELNNYPVKKNLCSPYISDQMKVVDLDETIRMVKEALR